MRQEMWLWLMTYEEAKLLSAYNQGHINALISHYLRNQFHSRNSPFFKRYKKQQEREDDLLEARNLVTEDIE